MKIKILCDVCGKDEAVAFCAADEAAICEKCDHRVHHANKLASKHPRFAFLRPAPHSAGKSSSMCDVCQEKKAFLFCRQDRAILCGDCDLAIHAANSHTLKHNRFFLPGIEVSTTPFFYVPTAKSSGLPARNPLNVDSQFQHEVPLLGPTKKQIVCRSVVIDKDNSCSFQQKKSSLSWNPPVQMPFMEDQCTSTFSNYLMEMLPGSQVEDNLHTTPPSKIDDGVSSFWGMEYDSETTPFHIPEVPSDNLAVWVPQELTPPDFVCPQSLVYWDNVQ